MSYGYRGAIVVRQPPSALNYLLGGLGQGFAYGMEKESRKTEREKEEKKNLVRQFLQGVAEGKIPAEMFGTPEMQDLLEYTGVSGTGPIQKLMGGAAERAEKEPGKQMLSPTGAAFQLPHPPQYTKEEVQGKQAEKARQIEMSKFYGIELPEEIAKTQARKNVERAFEKTPGQKVMEAAQGFQAAQDAGLPVENMTINGVNFYTAVEKNKDWLTQQQKRDAYAVDYDKALGEGMNYRRAGVQFISGIKTGETTSLLTPAIQAQMTKIGMNMAVIERAERMPAKQRIPLLVSEYNKAIKAKNQALRTMGIRAGKKGADIEQIEEIDPHVFDVEETPTPTPGADPRNMILGNRASKGPSPEEVDEYAQKIMAAYSQMTQQNPGMVLKPLTMDEARKIAREKLKKK